ncbi:MAG: YIP1 family protein [Firmicutes bacterium]|nr:YIP1 family protein [Bacillota bacterium]
MLKEIFSIAFRLVRSPFTTFPEILAQRPFRPVARMVLLGQGPVYAVVLATSMALLPNRGGASPHWRLWIVLAAPLLALLAWGVNALFLHAVARLIGSAAPFGVTFLVCGCTAAPYLFVLPLLPFPQTLLAQILFFLANGWSLFLLYIGLLLGHGLSRGRTFLVVFLGQFLLPLLLGLAAFLL